MKQILLLSLLLSWSIQFFGQVDKTIIQLCDSISLTLYRASFDPKGKKIEYYDGKYLYAIDGRPLFGTDEELPKTQLKKTILTIGKRKLSLQVDNMYNPWFCDTLDNKLFKITKDGIELRLRGLFSDGAGSYGAEWLIKGEASIRMTITTDEWFFKEFENQNK